MSANAARLTITAGVGLAAVYGFGLGIASLFAAVMGGFVVYALLLVYAVIRVKPPESAGPAMVTPGQNTTGKN